MTILLMVLCAVSLFAGGQGETEQGTEKSGEQQDTVVFVTPLIGHPVWLDAKKGAEDAAEELGLTMAWVGPATIDMEAQISQIEIALAENALGILNCPLNPTAFEPVYKQAMNKNIPIVNTAVDMPGREDLRLAYIGTDQENYGKKAAEVLAEKMGGKANIAVMQTSLDSGNQNQQFAAFKATLDAKYPDMKVIVRESTNSDMVQAVDKINTIFLTYPEVNAIFCLEASSGPAAGQILKETGKEGITVLAIDDMEDTLGYIRDGYVWATMTQNFYRMGYEGVQFIVNHHDGKSVPSVTDSGTTVVTIDNIDTYKK